MLTTLSDGHGKCVTKVPTVVKPVLEMVDVHMHLDKFVEMTGHRSVHMERLTSLNCCPMPPISLLFYVINNSFLSSNLQKWELLPEAIGDPKAKIAYSIHLKTAGRL